MILNEAYLLVQEGYDKSPKTGSWFTDYIYFTVNRRNKNFLGLFQGQTGSGKSWSTLRMAEVLDPKFVEDPEFAIRRVVFSTDELFALLNNPEENDLRPGSVICFEEIGVAANSRRAMSQNNMKLNEVVQIFRNKNYILLMNTPRRKFVDAQVRELLHCIFTTQGINFSTNRVLLVPRFLVFDTFAQQTIEKSLIIQSNKSKQTIRVQNIQVGAPSKRLVALYEKKKLAFVNSKIQSNSQPHKEPDDKKDLVAIARSIDSKYSTLKEKLEQWRKQTGRSRPTFYRYLESHEILTDTGGVATAPGRENLTLPMPS